MSRPERKHPRLRAYDYSQSGCYFVTICTRNRLPLLAGADLTLTALGEISGRYIRSMPGAYHGVTVEHFAIMPNHIHLLLTLTGGPSLQTVVRSFKTLVTRAAGRPVWQASFYDRIVRDEAAFLEIWRYIEENPAKWAEDPYHVD